MRCDLALDAGHAVRASDGMLWAPALLCLAVIPLIVWAAVRENSAGRITDRRLWIFAHPVSTVVSRIVVSSALIMVMAATVLLAVFVSPPFWAVVLTLAVGDVAVVVGWVLVRRGPDLAALGESDASED